MKYKIIASDNVKDERLEYLVESKSVFDAIDMVVAMLENPEETELIEAILV